MTRPASRTGAAAPAAALLLLLAAAPASAQSGDPMAGRELAGQCRACHGLDGLSRQPDAPNIAAEPERYLAEQLRAYRSGRRQHPQMSVVAQGLSDADIANLAAYYGAIEIEVTSVPGGR